MAIIGTYTLTDRKTGKFYVGSSENVQKRIDRHIRDLTKNEHHCPGLQELWNKRPSLFETVIPTETREEAYALEQDIIDRHLNSDSLLNIGMGVKGGDNLTRHPDREKIIKKIHESHLLYLASLMPWEKKIIYGKSGPKNGMWGKTHDTEARKKMSHANLGITRRSGFTLSEEHRKQLSEHAKTRTGDKNPFFGKKHSEEMKHKLSAIQKAKGTLPANTRTVEVDGKQYPSLTEASRQLGVSPALVVHRLKSELPIYKGYRYTS